MTYASQQNMIDRFGSDELIQLTDRGNLGVIDTAVLGQALADANTEIDSYLSSVCTLPLVTIPPRLIKIAADIARYELYGARCTDQVRARYTDAIAYLKLVVAGTVSLGLDPQNQPVAEVGGVGMNAKAPVFAAGDNAVTGNLADY
jgi:phage gp36-like protein